MARDVETPVSSRSRVAPADRPKPRSRRLRTRTRVRRFTGPRRRGGLVQGHTPCGGGSWGCVCPSRPRGRPGSWGSRAASTRPDTTGALLLHPRRRITGGRDGVVSRLGVCGTQSRRTSRHTRRSKYLLDEGGSKEGSVKPKRHDGPAGGHPLRTPDDPVPTGRDESGCAPLPSGPGRARVGIQRTRGHLPSERPGSGNSSRSSATSSSGSSLSFCSRRSSGKRSTCPSSSRSAGSRVPTATRPAPTFRPGPPPPPPRTFHPPRTPSPPVLPVPNPRTGPPPGPSAPVLPHRTTPQTPPHQSSPYLPRIGPPTPDPSAPVLPVPDPQPDPPPPTQDPPYRSSRTGPPQDPSEPDFPVPNPPVSDLPPRTDKTVGEGRLPRPPPQGLMYLWSTWTR